MLSGNPGLLDFYIPFLSSIYKKDTSGRLAILAHAHVGHTPGVGNSTFDQGSVSLVVQIQSAVAAFDALTAAFSTANIIVVGHSVGAWISLQVKQTSALDNLCLQWG